MLIFDHLTVAALTLEQGVAHIERALGVVIPAGGAHPLMGTHNHLMRIGEGAFLELVAPDPAVTPQRPRWFGLDDPATRKSLQGSPRLVNWVARVPDLGHALGAVDCAQGEAVRVTRGELSWLISVPPDGSLPFDGAFPTLIEWPSAPHPSSRMADLDCRLNSLSVVHPQGARLARALAPVFSDDRVTIATDAAIRLRATIDTPGGTRELS
jgi:hypothetical protein